MIDPATIIADSKSGTSGAGRGAAVGSLVLRGYRRVKAYKVAEHRHTPEIEQEISQLTGRPVVISFTPHLLPMSRGIFEHHLCQTAARESMGHGCGPPTKNSIARSVFVRLCLGEGEFRPPSSSEAATFVILAWKLDPRTGRIVIVFGHRQLGQGGGRSGGAEHEPDDGLPRDARVGDAAVPSLMGKNLKRKPFPFPTSLFPKIERMAPTISACF